MPQTVRRALSLIKLIDQGPVTLTDAAQHLDVHKSTALRTLQALAAEGFVRQAEDGSYVIGMEMVAVAFRAFDAIDLRDVARPYLQRLGRLCGHTVHLAGMQDASIYYLDKVDARGSVRMRSRVGTRVELHTAGLTKAILAHLPESQLAEFVAQLSFTRYTATTLTNEAALRRELTEIRHRGWAEDNGEFEDYLGCVAAPVRNLRGEAVGAVSITALRSVADRKALHELVPELVGTAARISQRLGWRKH